MLVVFRVGECCSHILVENQDTLVNRLALNGQEWTIGDKVKSYPSDSPLLQANKATTFSRGHTFANVHRDLCRLDADAETVDDATNDQHGNVLRGADDGRADDPNHTADHDCLSSSQHVRQVPGNQGTKPRSSSHGGGDATLDARSGTLAFSFWGDLALVEVAFVRLSACGR